MGKKYKQIDKHLVSNLNFTLLILYSDIIIFILYSDVIIFIIPMCQIISP